MASKAKARTTQAKLARENALRERRAAKAARKVVRRRAAEDDATLRLRAPEHGDDPA